MSKAEIVVQIAIKPDHDYAPLWSSMNEGEVVKLLRDMIYLKADGYVNNTGRHPGNVYTLLAGVSSDAYRLFNRDHGVFVEYIFGADLDRDFGVTNISVYEAA